MRGVVLGVLVAVLACACGDDDGGSGTGGAAGIAGSGGSGGSAGTAGSGGSAGTAGSGGSSGSGGSGGSAGTGGHVHVGTEACCEEHTSPGCSDPAVEECVCTFNELCCTGEWNDACVALARADNEIAQCGNCKGSCCESKTTPGCDDPTVEACVCEGDADCCTVAWDSLCVSILTLNTLCGTSCQ